MNLLTTKCNEKLEEEFKISSELRSEVRELEMRNSSLEGSLSAANSHLANLQSDNEKVKIFFDLWFSQLVLFCTGWKPKQNKYS